MRNDLITVLNGYLTRSWGVEHTGLEVLAEPRGLPDDLSPVLGDWAAPCSPLTPTNSHIRVIQSLGRKEPLC